VNFFVRAMRESDVEQVMAVAQTLAEAPHWPKAAYIAAMGEETAPPRIALVAESSGEVVGLAVASVMTPQAELESIAVAGGAQRQGVATALLRELAEELVSCNVAEILLELRVSNDRAAAFYEQFGFVSVGRRRSYYQDPVEDALLLKLNLAG
jgi:ribosomal-protein-alanine N-acetyltransferase